MASGAPSEVAVSDMPVSEADQATPAAAPTFPPYPPYVVEPAPPSVADTITAGRDMRVQHKSTPAKPVRPAPKPAKPKGPKATDVKMAKRASRAHARCLRRHGAVLTDRLERMAKPPRRNIICLWRERAETLPADTIARLRSMLDADEPFKPDQAYEYFINLNKNKKKTTTMKVNQIKKDVLAMCGDKRFVWARNATVAFARGIQQRLARPGRYCLADGMLRLSNIIMADLCGHMHMNVPSRRCSHPKARFMMEMADKVAVWIDEILTESDDRMLMMDFDEDDDVLGADETGDAGFADDFLNMMGGGGLLKGPQPAYLKFSGEMLEAFMILTGAMEKKGSQQLLAHGKFTQTYAEGADELKQTTSFEASEFNSVLAAQLNNDLTETAKPDTPAKIEPFMKDMVNICSNYLAQYAEFNKDKGPAFRILIKAMRKKPNDQLYQKEKVSRTYGSAATELEKSKGLDSDHDDPNLSQEIHGNLAKLVLSETTPDLKADMEETLDICSKYLSQRAIDEIERGPAFDLLIAELEHYGGEPFTPQFPSVGTKFAAAYALKSAPGLGSVTPDSATAPLFIPILHEAVDVVTPNPLASDMNDVIERCANYLSAYVRDRDKALQALLKMMKGNASKELAKRNAYSMNYGTGAIETETAPTIIPYLPVKDIADEAKVKLTADMESSTPPELKIAMKSLIQDVAKHLSQPIAMRSGAAGERYPLDFLTAIKKSFGTRPLFKYKSYGQTYADAAEVLKYAGPLESDPKAEELQRQILAEMKRGVPSVLAPSIAAGLSDTMSDAAKHLAKVGVEKGDALEYLVGLMKEQGEAPLGQMQGYQQSYNDGARRIENSPSLASDKVDKGTYEAVRGKLTALTTNKPSPQNEKHLPGVVEDSSKFLASPMPDNNRDKRRVLADLMGRKGDEIMGQNGSYKLTYTQAGEEIMNAPVGVTTAKDEAKLKVNLEKVNNVIPDKKMQDLLNDPAKEGAAHITDLIGSGGANRDGMKGSTGKNLDQASMLGDATHLGGLKSPTNSDTADSTSKYITGVGTKECRDLDEQKRREDEERRLREAAERRALAKLSGFDPEREQAMNILHKQLRAKGGETLYKQPQTELTHTQASTWLGMKPPMKVDKTVKESADTARLSNKFERKLSTLVSKSTPVDMYDTMQDVVIESSRILSEYFVSSNYKTLVKDGLISEMQKRRNEILIEVDGATETFFFAAQRLKKAKSLEVKEPCSEVAYYLTKKLDDIIRCRSMARKLTGTMKEHVKDASDYLSELVTKPEPDIEAYVALLGEMEATGDTLLIEGDIPKSYKDSAKYLRQLTSYQDQINRANSSLQSSTESKLQSMMANVPPRGYEKSNLDAAIKESTKLLVSYIMLQGEKTEVLKILIGRLEEGGESVLLRHGSIYKSYAEGASLLKGKNADQLGVSSVDPVVSRKIQIKLHNLMHGHTPDKYQTLMDDVIEDATMYLAVYLLQPRVIQVCKCMKNVFVQCELWCDEILRRVARPCCTCSRHVSTQALADLAPAQRLRISPGSSRAFAPGLEITLTQCPSRQSRCNRRGNQTIPCPAAKPTPGCAGAPTTAQYLLYSTVFNQHMYACTSSLDESSGSPMKSYQNIPCMNEEATGQKHSISLSSSSFHTPASTSSASDEKPIRHWQTPTTMYAKILTQDINVQTKALHGRQVSPRGRSSPCRSGYSTRSPIVSTDQMSDWHAMMVSLMWNVQAWRDWIQENIGRALSYTGEPVIKPAEADESWSIFQRRVATEGLQWRQYNIFSRQLTMRLALRYRDKQIVSPTRATNKTEIYMECQQEMLDIIEMFNRWTQWLTAVVKETTSLTQVAGVAESMHKVRWNHFKQKVLEYSEDWTKYNMHLQVCWEHKYRTLIADWLPAWKQSGPVWVVSAFGAVPSGAVSAGVFESELVWVARTTHRCNVLPGALHPSKHCCVVYADGGVHNYTKYQVMCNADAKWLAWRAGAMGARAVRVSGGTHIGRVHYRGSHLVGAVHAPHYRCHVVIFGRPFAFNCYELLVLGEDA